MRILMISPVPIRPVGAGNRARIETLARQIQLQGHELHFALVSSAPADDTAMGDFFGAGRFYRIPNPREPDASRLLERIRNRLGFQKVSWDLDDWVDPSVLKRVGEIRDQHAFDVVIVEYVFISSVLSLFDDKVTKVLDTHDRFGDRHVKFLEEGRKPNWFSTSLAQEAKGLRRADVAVAMQDDEGRYFSDLLGGEGPRVVTVGHFVDAPQEVSVGEEDTACFLASANPINVSALDYFVSGVLPSILRRTPAFRLLLIGDIGDHVSDHPAIEKLGRVEDLPKALGRARIAITPVQTGTGMSIKLFDCLAAGLPTVSTACGARGISPEMAQAMVVVDDQDPQAFAAAVAALLHDDERRSDMAGFARQSVQAWNRRQSDTLSSILVESR